MSRLSDTQRTMLRRVGRGHAIYPDRPYQIGNTNRTADNLERRGLIEMAPDQTEARKTLASAWVLTEAGKAAL